MAKVLERARELQRAGEHRAAMAVVRDALAADPSSSDAHLRLGVLHAELLEHQPARVHLEKAIALDPRNADAMCMLATVLHDTRMPRDAERWSEEALRLRPGFAEAEFQRGLARFEGSRLGAALESFRRCYSLRRGAVWTEPASRLRSPQAPAFEPVEMAVNRVKLAHDVEQLEYLRTQAMLPAEFDAVLADYRALYAEVAAGDPKVIASFPTDRHPLVAATYKRPVHIDRGIAPEGEVVRRDIDWRAIEDAYLGSAPNLTTVDGLLAPPALEAVRRFCRESTVWNDVRPGYLGAYLHDGFACEVLLRAAAELRECMPRVIGELPLQILWAYKYDSALPGAGIGVHADSAAVNVNFWITDDEANLDPQRGGLLVYAEDAPQDWGFAKYNSDPAAIHAYLASCGAKPVRVPYRSNRAVIFDSDLFHATDGPVFRPGYLNRRINITLLYGLRSS